VEKFEWYFFHAVSYDLLWSLPFILPFLAVYLVRKPQVAPSRWYGLPYGIAIGVQMLYIAASAADHEIMRFLALHLSVGYVRTYLGPAAVADLPDMLGSDAGGVGLPVLLTFGVPFGVLWLARRWGDRFVLGRTRLRRILLPCVFGLALGYGLLFHFWRGSFRMTKLRPVPATLYLELTAASREDSLTPAEYGTFRDRARSLWGDGRDDWVFPEPEYPFYREPLTVACARPQPPARCQQDADGDGHPAGVDCRDDLPGVYPGAVEIPSNGIDEDCNGMDEKPWNVVLILLESHRATNVGHLDSKGEGDTPTLDALAARDDARIFTRHQVNGVPTIEGFLSAHCSVYSKGSGNAATENTAVAIKCLPDYLRAKGIQTRFFTASAPDWDNQTYWLARWYDAYDFARSRQTDVSMFAHMGDWMRDTLSADTPFFVGAITKTNHFPFNPVSDMTEAERAATPRKIGTTMRYTERAMADFFRRIEGAPWFSRTVFIITADHGFNWGERGYYRLMDPMIRASTWLPLVFVGDHPALAALPKRSDVLSSHVDLPPTILDLLGVRAPNHFVGHSLFDARYRRDSYVYASHWRDTVWERGTRRLMIAPPKRIRSDGDQVFDTTQDFFLERPMSGAEVADEVAKVRETTEALWRLTNDVYRRDRLIPAALAPAAP